MGHILLYNVGNRDLRLDGALLPADRFRSVCQALLADPTALSRVEAPQLRSCLDHLRTVAGVRRLEQLFLFVTDRNPHPRFSETDTAAAGDLLRHWLAVQAESPLYKTLLGGRPWKLLKIEGVSPNDYGQVYERYHALFTKLPPTTAVTQVWLYPVSGTPAMTMALVLHSLARWREKVRVLLLPEGTTMAVETPFPTLFLTDLQREAVIGRLASGDFAGAVALLGEGTDPARLVARAGLARSRFDFRRADQLLAEAVGRVTDGVRQQRLLALRTALQPLCRYEVQEERAARITARESRPFLVELLFNTWLCWRAQREIDFLGRVYRLHEGLLRYWLEMAGFPTDDSPGVRAQSRPAFWMRVEQLGLTARLGQIPEVTVGGPLNRAAFAGLIAALLERRPAGIAPALLDEMARLWPLVSGPLQRLGELRNQTILGHGFEPVPRAAVMAEVLRTLPPDLSAGADPVLTLLEALRGVLAPEIPDPYQEMAAVCQALLEG